MRRTIGLGLILILLIVGVFWVNQLTNMSLERTDNPTNLINEEDKEVSIVAENLSIPWEMEFLPDGSMLVTERSGRLLEISSDRKTIIPIDGVAHVGEGGLMGLALHPEYDSNKYIFLYLTYRNGNGIFNRVEKYKLEDVKLSERQVIIDGIRGASIHDGGRIRFGPDKRLYITTGDAGVGNLAQDTQSLNGKILRVNDDGSIPEDNPFGNAVYSFGHRNPQGLAWDNDGRLWATEHGPSGSQTGFDEINLIEKGKNYGWPIIRGNQVEEGMVAPVIQSGGNVTWAPGGATVVNGSLFFAGLRGEKLYEIRLNKTEVIELVEHLDNYGRLRAVAKDSEGNLYVSTSNKDGRGKANEGDDKIIKIIGF